jgi:hypothetical protein
MEVFVWQGGTREVQSIYVCGGGVLERGGVGEVFGCG